MEDNSYLDQYVYLSSESIAQITQVTIFGTTFPLDFVSLNRQIILVSAKLALKNHTMTKNLKNQMKMSSQKRKTELK
jgi:hypothetical protein